MGGGLNAGSPRVRRILVVAGEPSGDHHAAALVRALAQRMPIDVRGVAGPALLAAGATAVVPQERLAVIGFSGVLSRLPDLFRARAALLRLAREWRPDAALLVDYPGFNLRLGPQLAKLGVRTLYYIAPQVWAWHPQRAQQMARWVDRLAVVFPFEEDLFRQAGVDTVFVGHPLLDGLEPEVDAATLRSELGAPAGAPLLGLLPGSRVGEIARHAQPMLEAAQRLRRRFPGLRPVVALAEGRSLERIPEGLLEGVAVLRGRTRAIQAHAAVCAVASGTATLETALLGTPLVIVYRVGWLNAQIARRVLTLPRIGLPNIVAGAEVAPELLLDAFTPAALADRLALVLDDPAEAARQRAALAVVRTRLGGGGAAERAAAAFAEVLA